MKIFFWPLFYKEKPALRVSENGRLRVLPVVAKGSSGWFLTNCTARHLLMARCFLTPEFYAGFTAESVFGVLPLDDSPDWQAGFEP